MLLTTFLATGLYVDGATTSWTIAETATAGVFTISNDGNYLAGNGVDAVITTTTDGTAESAKWNLISYDDFVASLEGEIGVSGVDATPYIKDPELKRNGNFTTWSGAKPWTITGYNGSGTPSNFSQGQDGNNASCAESYQSENGFMVAQTLTGLKPGKYQLTAQAFYRQDGSDTDNYPYLFVGDAKSYFPERTGTENNMVEAYSSFLAGTYPVEPISFIVSSESDDVTIGYANANVKMWNIFGQTQLTYFGTCLASDAVAFTNGGSMVSGQWYYFDATVSGTYEFTAGSDISEIIYTTDGDQATASATGSALTVSPSLSATRYYFKSSISQALTVDVPTGAQVVNADINFNNAIVAGTVAGTKGSLSVGSGNITANGELQMTGDNNIVTIASTEYAGTRDIVNVSFDLCFGNLVNRQTWFYMYGSDDNEAGHLSVGVFSNTMDSNLGFTSAGVVKNAGNDPAMANRTHFEIVLNYVSNTITTTITPYTNGSAGTANTETVSMINSNPLKQIKFGDNYNTRYSLLDNLVITTTKGDYTISEVSYTVKFKDAEGNTLKSDDTSREAVIGTEITSLATSADKTTFYNDGDIANNSVEDFVGATNKYVYKSVSAVNSSEESIDELEEGAVVTIIYDKHNKYDYAVKQKLGDAAATDRTTGSLWDDQTFSYYFPVGVQDGSDYYFTEPNGSSPYFRGTLTSAVPTVTINYTLDPTVVFYSEGEDLASKTGTYGHYPALMANGQCGVLNDGEGNLVTSLSAGTYTITARTVGRGDADRHIYFYKGSVDGDNIVLTTTPNYSSGSTQTSEAFTLAAPTNILVKGAEGGGANGRGLDYVIIRKTAEVGTIPSSGIGSLASAYGLNFAAATVSDGELKAYVVTEITADRAKVSSVDEMPGNSGVILEGTAGATYSIPVKADATFDGTNKLQAAVTATPIAANEAYILKSGEFHLVTAASTVPAGKAYLLAEDVSFGTKALRFDFDGLATSINGLANGQQPMANGTIFNLAGQRVNKAVKGLYIVNGKKIVK